MRILLCTGNKIDAFLRESVEFAGVEALNVC